MSYILESLLDPRVVCAILSLAAFALVALVIRYGPRAHMVFINYRKDDTDFPGFRKKHGTSKEARKLTRTLRKLLPHCRVLLDVDNIDAGSDWRLALKTMTQKSSALVCLIGKQWLTLTGENGTRRLFEPNDIVREELVAALDHRVQVFPLQVNGGMFPRKSDVPKALLERDFIHYQAVPVSTIGVVVEEEHEDREENDESLKPQLNKLVTDISKHITHIESRERPAQLWDFFRGASLPLVVLWALLLGLSLVIPSPAMICVIALMASLMAFAVEQSYKAIPNIRLIHDTRCREPDFNWARARDEYLYCARRSFGQQTIEHVVRVRVESAVIHAHPEEPIPEDNSKLHEKKQSDYQNDRQVREQKLDEATSIAVNMKFDDDGSHIRPTLTVGTCFDLHAATKELKRYLTMVRQKSKTRTGEFYSEVKIEQGFLSPQFLTTGLMDHFEENWEPVLDWYGEAVEQPCPAIISKTLQRVQVFEFLCWLTWGPSVPHCECTQWRSRKSARTGGVFLQFGYGDENNSFLLCDSDKTMKPAKAFLEEAFAADPNSRAIQCTATIVPVLASDVDESLCFAQDDAGKQGGIILRATNITPFSSQEKESHRRIYQAYVWMMFVLCDANGDAIFPEEPWRGLLPFFTHGNIAEPDTYRFIREEVARKSADAIKSILTHSPLVRFRFACSSDASNCGSDLMFPPAKPTMLDCFVREMLSRMTRTEQACVIVPNAALPADPDYRAMHPARTDEDDFQKIYAACHLPERLSDFYDSIADEDENVDPNAASLHAVNRASDSYRR